MNQSKWTGHRVAFLVTFLRSLEDILFPPRCPVCDGLLSPGEEMIHPDCRKLVYPVLDPVCMHCGKPLGHEAGEYCLECRKNIRTRGCYRQGKSVFLYKEQMKKSIYRFKYSNRREYAAYYAAAACRSYEAWIRRQNIDAIVPVPMYPAKQRLRGYNQAECFGRELSGRLDIPLERKLLQRCRNTKPLKMMNEESRRKMLKGAFAADARLAEKRRLETVLLVDDIYTTGSTVEEAALALQKAGIKTVYILTICTAQGI